MKSSERARKQSQTIEEVSKAINYLNQVVNSDPTHIEEVLKHVKEIKISLESEISMNDKPVASENPLYSSAIHDMSEEKSQIMGEIAIESLHEYPQNNRGKWIRPLDSLVPIL